jgi:hypothetical protein
MHQDLTFVWPGQARENVHQGGLPGTVLAQQRVNLADPELEIHLVIGNHAGETFGHTTHG